MGLYIYIIWGIKFFPRASERRVLPIVGVCISSSHLHICSSSHLHIFSSSHLHIFWSSHLLIFTSSHLHIFSSSHLLIFTSAHLHIFTSSHLHICSSSHLHIFSSSHLHIFTSCSSCPLALSFFSISPLKAGAGAVPTRRHETQPFRTKRGSIVKNCGKIAICKSSRATLSHETRFDRQKLRWNCDLQVLPRTLSHETRFDRQKLR